ncbi:ABC transporter permease [Actinomadura rubrisoli]|uniref:ABC transporter permease n=1 Tax=Actinomadura rubrisoli TaxID=2530368 RepID=A0A4R5AA52_9ACTN|nr:ABC transporter permease [Actinomadura rubrisoli]TDD69173.1 ABC transporter permease [Actinomadura rubrisoli]
MIWLTWRQLRAAAAMMAAALAVLAAVLGLTGPGLADDYSTGVAACVAQNGGCARFFPRFFHDNQALFFAVTAAMLLLPALVGLFWGAPLITRELEAGTHRLVWNQSITRTRWLAVKLALTGTAAMTAAGLGTLAVTWWSGPLDKSANTSGFTRMGPLLFDARGIVPIGYAAFAFVLGVFAGMLVRRTLPAMAVTLAAFAVLQTVMPLLVRPHLLPPIRTTSDIRATNVEDLFMQRGGGPLHLVMKTQAPNDPGAWVLSTGIVDASGRGIGDDIPVSTSSGPCAPPKGRPGQAGRGEDPFAACFTELKRLGYRQKLTYQPSDRFWPFQWIETGIYAALTLGLAGSSFWWLRRRLS